MQRDLRPSTNKPKTSDFEITHGKEPKGTGRLAKRKLSWDASPSPAVVGYRVYWAIGKRVTYDADFVDVGNLTSLTLPDGIPSFPLVAGQIEIGVTSISRSGNESDMCILSAFFDFIRPEAPLGLTLEEG
jgi:hypothetical protein